MSQFPLDTWAARTDERWAWSAPNAGGAPPGIQPDREVGLLRYSIPVVFDRLQTVGAGATLMIRFTDCIGLVGDGHASQGAGCMVGGADSNPAFRNA